MNHAFLIGNLTKDPELRVTQTGIPVCSFTIAINRRRTNAQGEREADFLPIVVWRVQGENCAKYLRKGSKVAVLGSIQTRTYDAQDGSRRYVTEIIADEVQFLNTQQNTGGAMAGESAMGAMPYTPRTVEAPPAPTGFAAQPPSADLQSIDDDELPF